MNAYANGTIYAIVDDWEGKTYPSLALWTDLFQDLRCYSEELFKGKKEYKVTFLLIRKGNIPFTKSGGNQAG